jgi:hypothetical protein
MLLEVGIHAFQVDLLTVILIEATGVVGGGLTHMAA